MKMRRLIPIALLLLLATPAFALMGEDMDSEHQTQQYGHVLGGVLIGAAALVLLVGGYIVLKGIRAEHERGKKRSAFREEILDKKPMKEPEKYIGEKVPEWKIDNRQKATIAVLDFLAEHDKYFGRKKMTIAALNAFGKVKSAIESRSTREIERLVMPDYLQEVHSEIKKLRKQGKIHVFGRMEVSSVVFIHVAAPDGKKNHTFVALITAKSKDYLKDEESGQVVRGDKKLYGYQEFWCFRRSKQGWLVERVRPTGDMDRILGDKNVLSPADLKQFSKEADDDAYLREFVGR
jgi:hypothetical protein